MCATRSGADGEPIPLSPNCRSGAGYLRRIWAATQAHRATIEVALSAAANHAQRLKRALWSRADQPLLLSRICCCQDQIVQHEADAMRILLTGSSGWLGRFLAPRLREQGHVVIGLDVAPGADTDVVGSVAERLLVERVFAEHGIEAVVHAGALHKPDIARYPAQAFVDVNVSGTLNLLESAAEAGHDRFVFTSTTSLMVSEQVRAGKAGGAGRAFWIDEDFGSLAPRNIYGATKLAAEHLCRLHHQAHGMAIAVLRTGRFFPEEDDTHRDLAGPNIKANEFLNRRLTVEDAADAHLAALEAAPAVGFG